jgi:hypothetical protein
MISGSSCLGSGDSEQEVRTRRNFMLKINYWAVVVAALAGLRNEFTALQSLVVG